MLLIEALIFFVLLLLSAYFSSIETALTSQTKLSIKHMIATRGIREDKFNGWLENPNRLLTTILVANNSVTALASVTITFIALRLAEIYHWSGEVAVSIATTFSLVIIIIFGEIIPKVFAKQNSGQVAVLFIGPLEWVARLLGPILKVLLWISGRVLLLSGRSSVVEVPFLTAEEIRAVITAGEEDGVLKEDQKQMIHSIFEFGNLTVREVMIPRTEMVCVDMSLPTEELMDRVIESGYSRLPVYKDQLDHMVGFLYTKDLLGLLKHRELIIIQDLIRPTFFVPENVKVNEVLKEFQKGKIHMALVVDEYGMVTGLITLEDLIEEIVGEIRDEYDIQDKRVERLPDGSLILDARMDIQEVNQEAGLDLPLTEDSNTLAGFVMKLAGRIPKTGQKIEYKSLILEIMGADRRRIEKIKISLLSNELNQ